MLCDKRVMKLHLCPRYETSDYGSLCVQVVVDSAFAVGDVHVPLPLDRQLACGVAFCPVVCTENYWYYVKEDSLVTNYCMHVKLWRSI